MQGRISYNLPFDCNMCRVWFNKNAYAGPHTAVGWDIFNKFFLFKKTIAGFCILAIFPKVN